MDNLKLFLEIQPSRSKRLLNDLSCRNREDITPKWNKIFDDICIPAAIKGKTKVEINYSLDLETVAHLTRFGVESVVYEPPTCICIDIHCTGCLPHGKTILRWF
jgi:hypothetical protein